VAKFQIENAFGLPYTGVHVVCLYFGLAIFVLVPYPVYLITWRGKEDKEKHFNSENSLLSACIFAFVGSSIKLFSYINHSENGVFWCFGVGQVSICLALAIQYTVTLLVNKHLYRDLFSLLDTVGAVANGLIIATFVAHGLFVDTDKFFTKVAEAQSKNFAVMVTQWFIFLLLLIFKVVRKFVLKDSL